MTITMPEIVVPKIDEATEQLVADLQTARDLIAVHGLVKEEYLGVNGGYCAIGAVRKAASGGATMSSTDRSERSCRALATTLGYGERDRGGLRLRLAIYDYNDSPLTEKADILSLFDVTIARLSA